MKNEKTYPEPTQLEKNAKPKLAQNFIGKPQVKDFCSILVQSSIHQLA